MWYVLNKYGVVRATPKAEVRGVETDGVAPGRKVGGMLFSYDTAKVQAAIENTLAMPGIGYVRVWLANGELAVGDDIMYVLIGGDIRPRVVDALQALVGAIKTNVSPKSNVKPSLAGFAFCSNSNLQ